MTSLSTNSRFEREVSKGSLSQADHSAHEAMAFSRGRRRGSARLLSRDGVRALANLVDTYTVRGDSIAYRAEAIERGTGFDFALADAHHFEVLTKPSFQGLNMEHVFPALSEFLRSVEDERSRKERQDKARDNLFLHKKSADKFTFNTVFGRLTFVVDRNSAGERVGLIAAFSHDFVYFPAFDFDYPSTAPDNCWGRALDVNPLIALSDEPELVRRAADGAILVAGYWANWLVVGVDTSRSNAAMLDSLRESETRGLQRVSRDELANLQFNPNNVVPNGLKSWHEAVQDLIFKEPLVGDLGRSEMAFKWVQRRSERFKLRNALFVGIDPLSTYRGGYRLNTFGGSSLDTPCHGGFVYAKPHVTEQIAVETGLIGMRPIPQAELMGRTPGVGLSLDWPCTTG